MGVLEVDALDNLASAIMELRRMEAQKEKEIRAVVERFESSLTVLEFRARLAANRAAEILNPDDIDRLTDRANQEMGELHDQVRVGRLSDTSDEFQTQQRELLMRMQALDALRAFHESGGNNRLRTD